MIVCLSASSAARITLVRRSHEDVQQRQVVAALDGKPWATLLFGESATTDVEAGPHSLRIHNTLVWKTVEVDLKPGEHARFAVANRSGWGTFWMLCLLGVGPLYLTVTRDNITGP
jgi:hypothetical protein